MAILRSSHCGCAVSWHVNHGLWNTFTPITAWLAVQVQQLRGNRAATVEPAAHSTGVGRQTVTPSRRGQNRVRGQQIRREMPPEWRNWRKSWRNIDTDSSGSQSSPLQSRRQKTPSKTAYKNALGFLQQLEGFFSSDHPATRTLKAEVGQAEDCTRENHTAWQDLSELARVKSPRTKNISKRHRNAWRKQHGITALQKTLELQESKVGEVEAPLQERKTYLDKLSRMAAAAASRGTEATAAEMFIASGIAKHLAPEQRVGRYWQRTESAGPPGRLSKTWHPILGGQDSFSA